MDTHNTKGLSLPVSVVIAGVLIAGAVLWNGQNPGPSGSPQGGESFGDAASIDKLNAQLGLDAKKIAADVKANDAAYQAAIQADQEEGQKQGIKATPSFIIGTQLLEGAYPYAAFEAALNAPDKAGTVAGVDGTKVNTEGDPYLGRAGAPVTILFWSDFQCPYCKAFETGGVAGLENITPAFPDIIKNYVNTGKAKVVFMDFPLSNLHPYALTMALYGRAVWKLYPDQYYAWREAVYQAQ